MCIAIPAQVLSHNDFVARCQSRYGLHDVNTMLVGEVVEGEWLLVFMDSAREKISAEQAKSIDEALGAVENINLQLAKYSAENLPQINPEWQNAFADILARETGEVSRLPPHLQHLEKNEK